MKDLKLLFKQANCDNIKTFLNSGNVKFDYDGDIEDLAAHLENEFLNYGSDIVIFVRSFGWLTELVTSKPFGETTEPEGELWYVTFCNAKTTIGLPHTTKDGLTIFSRIDTDYLTKRTLGKKAGVSPNPVIEKHLDYATTRGWKTILRMVS